MSLSRPTYYAAWAVLLGFQLLVIRPLDAEDLSATAEAEALMTLQVAQSEGLQTLDTEVESSALAVGKTVTTRVHMLLDKAAGRARITHMAANGQVMADIVVDNGKIYFKARRGWQQISLPEQQKQELNAMGADLGSALGDNTDVPGADEKALSSEENQAVGAWLKQDTAPALASLAPTGSSEVQLQSLAARAPKSGRALRAYKQRKARVARKVAKRMKSLKTCRMPALDKSESGYHLRALRHTPKLEGALAKKKVKLEDIEWVDPETGLSKERGRYLPKDQIPGGTASLPKSVRRMTGAEGDELIELSHSRVLRSHSQNGVMVADETETRQLTGVGGEAVTVSRWNGVKVNEGLDKGRFNRE